VAHRWLKPLLKYLLGIAVLAYVLTANWRAKPGSTGPGLADALSGPIHFSRLALVGMCIIPAVLMTFVRWYSLVRALDLPLSPREGLRLGLLGYFFNTLLPGAVGGDLVKAAVLVRSQDRRTAAVASIIIDRVIGLLGLAALIVLSGGIFYLIGDPVLTSQPGLNTILRWAVIFLAVTGVGWFLVGFLSRPVEERIAERFEMIPKVGAMVAEAWRAAWIYRRQPRAVFLGLAITVAGHVFNVFAFHNASRVFAPENADLPTLREHFLLVPVGLAIGALFPAPGGLGGSEFSYGKLYELVGASASLGVLGSLAVQLSRWILGGLAYFTAQFIPAEKRDEPTRMSESAREEAIPHSN